MTEAGAASSVLQEAEQYLAGTEGQVGGVLTQLHALAQLVEREQGPEGGQEAPQPRLQQLHEDVHAAIAQASAAVAGLAQVRAWWVHDECCRIYLWLSTLGTMYIVVIVNDVYPGCQGSPRAENREGHGCSSPTQHLYPAATTICTGSLPLTCSPFLLANHSAPDALPLFSPP